jgi:hypothetical protein
MRIRPIFFMIVATTLFAACHKAPPKQVTLGAAFKTLPLPPDGQTLVTEGGAEAMRVVTVTPWRPDSVLAYYRMVLSTDPFHLINERTVGKATALYAEQDNGPPIWVTISPNGTEGSQVILAGAKDPNQPDGAGKVTTADSGTSTPLPVKRP